MLAIIDRRVDDLLLVDAQAPLRANYDHLALRHDQQPRPGVPGIDEHELVGLGSAITEQGGNR